MYTTEWYSFATPSKHSTINILQCVFFLFLLCKMPLSQENWMQMAISAIRNQKIQSKRKAAGIFEVSEATLCK